MARQVNRLTPRKIASPRLAVGYHADGGGLYLQVASPRSRSWIFAYALHGREREMGLGSINDFTLAEVRERARQCRQQLRDGIDPIAARHAEVARLAAEQKRSRTFEQCADAYVAAHRHDWRSAKHVEQWKSTLKAYCYPIFGSLSVKEIDTPLVLRVLEPIWTKKPETATRLRGRIERILTWATVQKLRTGDNPARWRGHLKELLPKIEKRKRVKHHPALPYSELGEFIVQLRAQEGIAARALEFTILTAARTGEVIGAAPDEFDLKAGVWTVPGARMKAGRDHVVPLPPHAIEIIKAQPAGKYVFAGMNVGQPLSNMAMLAVLDRMKRKTITVHGFRSTFRDWAAECTNFPREVCEMALAHTIPNAAEAAYRRGDLFEKRKRLMAEWAKYCDRPTKPGKGKVIRIGKAA